MPYLKTFKTFEILNLFQPCSQTDACYSYDQLFIISTIKALQNAKESAEFIKQYMFNKRLLSYLNLKCVISEPEKNILQDKIKKTRVSITGSAFFLTCFRINTQKIYKNNLSTNNQCNTTPKQTKTLLNQYAIDKIRNMFLNRESNTKSVTDIYHLLGCLYLSASPAKPLFISEAELKQSYLAQKSDRGLCRVNRTSKKKLGNFQKKLKKMFFLLTEYGIKPV